MTKQIILKETKKPFYFSESDLPMFIHGIDKAGASLFSVAVATQFFLNGKKIIFFTAYPMAKEEFLSQIAGSDKENKVFYLEHSKNITEASNFSAIIVKSGDWELCLTVLRTLNDVGERIIFVKNIESILKRELFSAVKMHHKLIFSGDVDKIGFAEEIIAFNFNTKILFSKPKINIGIDIPILDKYVGFVVGRENALVKLDDF
ncbi:hypothetical protein HY967_04550 [Candidatus Jorgensenbacteria bacterium]|nr:hypothetical protein [Candidatus Jorgensenbacteria bacterium]